MAYHAHWPNLLPYRTYRLACLDLGQAVLPLCLRERFPRAHLTPLTVSNTNTTTPTFLSQYSHSTERSPTTNTSSVPHLPLHARCPPSARSLPPIQFSSPAHVPRKHSGHTPGNSLHNIPLLTHKPRSTTVANHLNRPPTSLLPPPPPLFSFRRQLFTFHFCVTFQFLSTLDFSEKNNLSPGFIREFLHRSPS